MCCCRLRSSGGLRVGKGIVALRCCLLRRVRRAGIFRTQLFLCRARMTCARTAAHEKRKKKESRTCFLILSCLPRPVLAVTLPPMSQNPPPYDQVPSIAARPSPPPPPVSQTASPSDPASSAGSPSPSGVGGGGGTVRSSTVAATAALAAALVVLAASSLI